MAENQFAVWGFGPEEKGARKIRGDCPHEILHVHKSRVRIRSFGEILSSDDLEVRLNVSFSPSFSRTSLRLATVPAMVSSHGPPV
jgi:hypothetical protein